MDAYTALTTRQSAVKLGGPAPTQEQIRQVLTAATRVPDHGKLKPWAFVLIEGEARERFGDLMVETLKARAPDTPEPLFAKEREKALRAPLIVAVAAKLQPDHPKIPEIEQILSAGCAAYAAMLGFHALGYGTMWKTGAPAYDPAVIAALGLGPADRIVGYLYVGTDIAPMPAKTRPEPEAFVTRWTGVREPVTAG